MGRKAKPHPQRDRKTRKFGSQCPQWLHRRTTDAAPPSDAIVLFDGKNLDQWVSTQDKSPAKWMVADGVMTVNKAAGNIETRRTFKNYQLHLEWKIPENITGSGQGAATAEYF